MISIVAILYTHTRARARTHTHTHTHTHTAEPGYNDIGLHDTSHITPDILWYQAGKQAVCTHCARPASRLPKTPASISTAKHHMQ